MTRLPQQPEPWGVFAFTGVGMTTLRVVVFLLGLAFMAFGLAFAAFPRAEGRAWPEWSWLFSLGLLLAVAAHGWPDGLR